MNMEEEIEDIVGEVKLTDSQKSVATSNVYSMEFTDSSSDKTNSFGKETYILELYDSEDSENFTLQHKTSVIDLQRRNTQVNRDVQYEVTNKISKAACTSVQNCSLVAAETFTQTSKTLFELVQTGTNRGTLETQTSFVSITENRTYEYRIAMANTNKKNTESQHDPNNYNAPMIDISKLEDESSKLPDSDSETIKSRYITSEVNSEDRIIYFLESDSKENIFNDENTDNQFDVTGEFESNISDIEEDSLMENKNKVEVDSISDISDVPKSIDKEIEDLYNNLTKSLEITGEDRHYNTLSPLTEESTIKRESLLDLRPIDDKDDKSLVLNSEEFNKDILTNSSGGRVEALPIENCRKEFKLPPIQNRSCPNSPHLNFLFSLHPSQKLSKYGTLPCLYESQSEKCVDRWEIGNRNLASGESPLINPVPTNRNIHLPPIHVEGYVVTSSINKNDPCLSNTVFIKKPVLDIQQDAISIRDRIRELKMSPKASKRAHSKFNLMASESRSVSPSIGSPDGSCLYEAAERGCETLCVELLRRLKSSSWFEVSNTLEEIPNVLEKFWAVITEHRIADLIRQISAHVESPRTHVARSACSTLASVLKNTGYTKKPDFYEAVTLLLTKTGSFSRPVRRAANVALDAVVTATELSHSVTALCLHGVEHKSPLVRCAASRLLVVSCALAGGGRELLRARPPSAAAARAHALRSLAVLLDDKSTDVRKYAERLYSMLRPLPNFEAYYLTDVEVDVACRQMKKYDKLLFTGPIKDAR